MSAVELELEREGFYEKYDDDAIRRCWKALVAGQKEWEELIAECLPCVPLVVIRIWAEYALPSNRIPESLLRVVACHKFLKGDRCGPGFEVLPISASLRDVNGHLWVDWHFESEESRDCLCRLVSDACDCDQLAHVREVHSYDCGVWRPVGRLIGDIARQWRSPELVSTWRDFSVHSCRIEGEIGKHHIVLSITRLVDEVQSVIGR